MDYVQADADREKGDPSTVRRTTTARLQNRRVLIVQMTPQQLAGLIPAGPRASVSGPRNSSPSTSSISLHATENGNGPNARGTYPKEYTLRHPEIQWIHRGQGRYLPISQLKNEAVATLQRPTR